MAASLGFTGIRAQYAQPYLGLGRVGRIVYIDSPACAIATNPSKSGSAPALCRRLRTNHENSRDAPCRL